MTKKLIIFFIASLISLKIFSAQAILTTIPLGSESGNGSCPRGISVNISTKRIYSVNTCSNNVSVIDEKDHPGN